MAFCILRARINWPEPVASLCCGVASALRASKTPTSGAASSAKLPRVADIDALVAEVERRKARARQLGLLDLVFDVYFRIEHYAAWSKKAPDAVHPEFRAAREIEKRTVKGLQTIHGVELPIGDSTFVFVFDSRITSLPDGETFQSGTLTLTVDGQEVFGIDCSGDDVEYVGVQWKPRDVDSFIEGPWIEPLKAAATKILDWEEKYKRESEERRNRDKAAELKKKFGL